MTGTAGFRSPVFTGDLANVPKGMAPAVGTHVPVWYPRREPDAPAGKPLTPHRVPRLREQEDLLIVRFPRPGQPPSPDPGTAWMAVIGATPAEGDARSAGTSRESPPAPLATQPDEGLDPAIGEQHRSVQAFRGRRRRLRLAPWGLLAPIASPESAAPMCSTCSPRLRRRRCRIQNRDAMLAGSDRRPWPSRSRRTWRSRTTALVANRQPSRRVAEKTKAVPEGRGRARASR
jgi:hypothetical protein